MASPQGGSPPAGPGAASPFAAAALSGPTLASLSQYVVDAADMADLHRLSRLSSFSTMERYTRRRPPAKPKVHPVLRAFQWWAAWSVPGLGMFSEAYIIFSIGLIKPLQAAMFPACFVEHTACSRAETHAVSYSLVAGIICGMLLFGALGDVIGRCWGSRAVASIMLAGSTALVLAPLVTDPAAHLQLFIAVLVIYGVGVGGEYPMAASSAAERSQSEPSLRHRRGEQVVLTFSQQGMGNLVNVCVLLMLMAMMGQTGPQLDATASRNIIILQAIALKCPFAVAAAVTLFMTGWRYTRLKESEVWKAEREDAVDIAKTLENKRPHHLYRCVLMRFGPRLAVTSLAWSAGNFAFYGDKLFQSEFISALYPDATPFQRMQWAAVNSAVALTGYWAAAALVDRRWYGRRRMQAVGFLTVAVLCMACGAGYPALTASRAGYTAFQAGGWEAGGQGKGGALYFLSGFFNQFGPNCTTWLVAAEVFPTDVRTTFQGISAAWGKVGAIVANVMFGYVSTRTAFYLSSSVALLGCLATLLLLPDTTGLSLDETDRMHKYMLAGQFKHYHGAAIDPRHLSLFERYVLRWNARHDPALDAAHKELQSVAASSIAHTMERRPTLPTTPRSNGAPSWWSDYGWGADGGSTGSIAGSLAGLEPLGRGVVGPSWAASARSSAPPRRLPATGEEGEGEGGGLEAGEGGGGSLEEGRGGGGGNGLMEDVD
ncbi:MAG: major facilitator superfamily domain-containing protein [Monoraphidium minutum]|nr:MAG: major facilitator superfamily domain-containing protein [Monoraphidium minutum]